MGTFFSSQLHICAIYMPNFDHKFPLKLGKFCNWKPFSIIGSTLDKKATHRGTQDTPSLFIRCLSLQIGSCAPVSSLGHTSCRSQQLLQRARLLRLIWNFSIYAAMDCNSCWLHQILSWSEWAFMCFCSWGAWQLTGDDGPIDKQSWLRCLYCFGIS